MKNILRVFYVTTICLLISYVVNVNAATEDMSVYSYISPPTIKLLRKAELSDKDIESYVTNGLRQRSIKPINNNQLDEGSEDAMRVDLRKNTKGLVINLSVRQGASVHNMLQRWEGSRTLNLGKNTSSKKLRSDITNTISLLLEELKSQHNSDRYKKGSMMEE